ncbi:M56 family metallopeptidase [Streptomyces kunmingensis]|uniref:M56 family metallopeptidase n=1 Tax=Streptomyces kunmingensis TaxID=68225 RepID=A0ABU6C5A3_9ACTN|nr:M56 family metallopeptidase [Streptomyces kunmingensis]MEB3959391.1 M56 family metallopeptidase [Streptomyces kunmingensis]
MGVAVFLPLVLPLTAWPVARLAERHLHPRAATLLLTAVAVVLGLCSTLCLGLLAIVGTAQLPGNPLPDGWADPEVRAAVPHDEVVGKMAVGALVAVLVSGTGLLLHHRRTGRRTAHALAGLPPHRRIAILPDPAPYAHTLPDGRIVVSTGMLAGLNSPERRALFAHERAHQAAGHHRHLLLTGLAARANPFLRPLHTCVTYTVERWADEEAARAVGDRRLTARAVGKAALLTPRAPLPALPGLPFATPGPVPRRVAALLAPPPTPRTWPPLWTAAGAASWAALAGTAISATASANSALTLIQILHAATPL